MFYKIVFSFLFMFASINSNCSCYDELDVYPEMSIEYQHIALKNQIYSLEDEDQRMQKFFDIKWAAKDKKRQPEIDELVAEIKALCKTRSEKLEFFKRKATVAMLLQTSKAESHEKLMKILTPLYQELDDILFSMFHIDIEIYHAKEQLNKACK
jgi:uncharacterized protein YwqG